MSELFTQFNSSQKAGTSAVKHTMPVQKPLQYGIDIEPLMRLPVQRKLSIGSTDDPLEHEADAVADKVMRMPEQNFIQRKCAECEEEEKLQRKPRTSSVTPFIQAKGTKGGTVSDSIRLKIDSTRGGGSSMDSGTKSFMESRFGTDFSGVNIHTGDYAVQLSKQLNAQAFTVGNDVYFNSDKYNAGSFGGKQLLAHELTHVMQQKGSHQNNAIQRQEIEVDIMIEDPIESERLRREQGIQLPHASPVWSLLSPELIRRIQRILTQNGVTPSQVPATAISNPVFVLHDTAISMGSTAITRAVSEARGPLGGGAASYIPATGGAAIARPNFFDVRRPTATEFEKGNDILPLQQRLTNARIIWQNTKPGIRQTAMANVLAGLNLSQREITSETTAAVNQLNEATSSTNLVFSTGMWTVNEICNQIASIGIQNVVNNSANTQTLTGAYNIMNPFFATRNLRISSSVNIEIVQQRGGDCNPNGPTLPAYTTSQYNNVALMYLLSALQAGRFPRITTHFLVDKGAGTHCDPRCFNLNFLYQTISTLLTFSSTVQFGILPQYGTGAADNVWWSDTVCGGAHP